MRWNLENIPTSRDREFFEDLSAQGKRTPLDSEPKTDNDSGPFLQAFYALNRSRTAGMAANPLQLSDMGWYWEHMAGWCPLDDFLEAMQALDSAYMKHQAEEAREKK